jgi:hypothetical protein
LICKLKCRLLQYCKCNLKIDLTSKLPDLTSVKNNFQMAFRRLNNICQFIITWHFNISDKKVPQSIIYWRRKIRNFRGTLSKVFIQL